MIRVGNSRGSPGHGPVVFLKTGSGKFPMDFPERPRGIPKMFPGHVRETLGNSRVQKAVLKNLVTHGSMPGNFPGNSRELLGNFPGHSWEFREPVFYGPCPGNSRESPGDSLRFHVISRENLEIFPDIFQELLGDFPETRCSENLGASSGELNVHGCAGLTRACGPTARLSKKDARQFTCCKSLRKWQVGGRSR